MYVFNHSFGNTIPLALSTLLTQFQLPQIPASWPCASGRTKGNSFEGFLNKITAIVVDSHAQMHLTVASMVHSGFTVACCVRWSGRYGWPTMPAFQKKASRDASMPYQQRECTHARQSHKTLHGSWRSLIPLTEQFRKGPGDDHS